MKYNLKAMHVISAITFVILQIFIIFSTENPFILSGVFVFCIAIFLMTDNEEKLRRGVLYFVPFAIITIIINFVFSSGGYIVLFTIFNKSFTLESLIYALIFSLKLLLVIYMFSVIEVILDSDGAVSYFAAILPKSTLMLVVSFKLFPTLKRRLSTLKEVYSFRGIDFDKKGIKEQIKSYSPILAVLLESSMEGAFDIGEAAYVRGFLSGKRTVYQRQRLEKRDIILLFHMLLSVIIFSFTKLKELDSFNIYFNFSFNMLFNPSVLLVFMAEVAFILTFHLNWKEEEI